MSTTIFDYGLNMSYLAHNIRPVENDGAITERIRKKLMRDRIRRMREKP